MNRTIRENAGALLSRLIQNRGKADGCAAESNTAAAHVLIGK